MMRLTYRGLLAQLMAMEKSELDKPVFVLATGELYTAKMLSFSDKVDAHEGSLTFLVVNEDDED